MLLNIQDKIALNEFDTSRGMYLDVIKINGEKHLTVMKPASWMGLWVRKISLAFGSKSGTMRKVAQFLKEHENEVLKLNLAPARKNLLKDKLMKYEKNHNILFTCISKLFGERTGIYIDHQTKLKKMLDNCPIKSSDISNKNKSTSIFATFLGYFGFKLCSYKSTTEQQQLIGKILKKLFFLSIKHPCLIKAHT